MDDIVLADGGLYRCENGAIVKVKKFSESLYYKFRAEYVTHEDNNIEDAGRDEVWATCGSAVHYDCGWSVVSVVL